MRIAFRILFCLVLACALCSMPCAPVQADAPTLEVSVDRGVPLQLSGAATSVFIANPEVADVQVMSPTSIMVFGKRTGETTLMATDENGHTLVHRTIVVSQNLTDLRKELAAALPGNKIVAEAVPNGIVLTGDTHDSSIIDDAQKLAMRYVPKDGGQVINRIKVSGSNQIQIRVRFAEVSRNVDRSFGIDWGNMMTIGGMSFGIASGAAVAAAATNILTTPRPSNTTLSEPNDIGTFGHDGQRFSVNGMIDALAQDGLITILAEPNLTAMSGETASFLAGGEYPIPIPQANGTISIEYRTYGVSLSFTPTLVGENRINMHVKPEVSQLTDVGAITLNNDSIPALTTRKAETTVELASGQSFAIAGLLNNNQDQTINKYPFLGDMPVLGTLFRSTDYQNDQTELVIIITPYIVKPSGEKQLALPTDGFSPPSASDQILGLRYSGSDPNARTMSGPPTAVQTIAPPVTVAPTTSNEPIYNPSNISHDSNGFIVNSNINVGHVSASESSPTSFGSGSITEAPPPSAAPVTPVSGTVASPSGPGGFVLE